MKRSRVRADRQFHRSKSRSKAIPVAVAASLAVVTAGYSILQYFDPMTTYAKESFSGIGKIVEEHDQNNPYHILDIVPSEASYDGYTFAAGTIGYLTNGGITLTQELKKVYTGNEATYRSYEERQKLFEKIISQTAIESFPGVKYEEAYGGIHTDHDEADGWSLLFDSKEINSSSSDPSILSDLSWGVFKGTAESAPAGVSGEEYAFKKVNASGGYSLRGGIYQMYLSNPDGDWHVTFAATDDPESEDSLYVLDDVSEYNIGSYSKATGLYLKEEDGTYSYAGTVDEIVYGNSSGSGTSGVGNSVTTTPGTGTGNTGENGENAEDNMGEAGENSEGSTGENSEGSTGENSEGSTGENSEGSTGENSEGSTGETPGGSTEETSGGSTEETTGSNTGENNSTGENNALTSASAKQWYKLVESGGQNQGDDDDTPLELTTQYYVLTFMPVDFLDEDEYEGDELVYYVPAQEEEISSADGTIQPFDAYELLQVGTGAGMEEYGIASFAFTPPTVTDKYVYVGPGNGNVKLVPSDSDTASYLGVYNAPVYIRCNSGNSWLEQYVFSSLENGDNERSSFAIEVETVRADNVDSSMLGKADLIYLESGINTIINPGLYLDYIHAGDVDWTDMGEGIAGEILRLAADDLLPVIVDYDIVENEDHYKDTNYQYLARALLKKDLATFYAEMNVKGNLMDNLKMNVGDNDDYPNKTDNNYHYVNKNIYIMNADTPLVSEDFHDDFDEDDTERGFSDVIAAIKAENTTLSEEDQISEKVSKARAIQYIINYSVGIVGEFSDLRILEIQPTANITSDLKIEVDDKKKNTKLCWKTEGMQTAKQILSSKKSFDAKTTVKSAAQFNGEWEDINTSYDLVFIGLDGQRLNLGTDKNRSPVYNNEKLNGKVYHTGDDSGVGTYDSNDITAQKMSDLLDYMAAGYPVMVENNCFKGGSAKKVDEDDINTKYIDKDSVMYRFLKSAVTDDRYKDRIYTVSDTMSSAMFITQINIGKPKLELQQEGEMQPSKLQQLSLDENQEYHGKIAYNITDRNGEAYLGDTELHLYVDLNYDGMFSEQEELEAQVNEGNVIDVKISGMGPGILSWKLEVVDSGNHYRRDSVQGYFELLSSYSENVSVLQITESKEMNLQEMYDNMDNSLLAYCLKGAESIANLTMQFETVTSGELSTKLSTDSAYLDQWDVIVLTLDSNSVNDSVADAVTKYVNDGRSLLVCMCSQDAGGNRMGLSAELLGQTQENRTYVALGKNGAGGYYRYAGLKSDMFAPLTQLQSEQVNEGSIAYYPYQLENRTFACGANSPLRASEYLLDFENNLKSESDAAYVTVWYTLGGGGVTSAYNISPKDARNNYYCYSKGNVVYLGQAEYPYSYDPEAGEKPETKDGIDECKFFVNALMAAYSAGVHNADVSIVAGFGADAAEVQSITIPFDQEWKDASDETEGILDNTVDVYFKFADSNIAMDKNVQISFYYEDPAGSEQLNVMGKSVQATPFGSEIWTVTDNKLVAGEPDNLQPGKVYRIKAPVVTLKNNSSMNNANIYVVLHSKFRRGSKNYEISGADAVSLNRAQMFLLE
ncbi:MAG: DUF5057 domain-containing protein [Lachnospiraceae bacterium]|nr:DUF5057 domain-containing protein [Lachnospiraceae bacterium]